MDFCCLQQSLLCHGRNDRRADTSAFPDFSRTQTTSLLQQVKNSLASLCRPRYIWLWRDWAIDRLQWRWQQGVWLAENHLDHAAKWSQRPG
jgi:hypothetical protein